MRRVWAALAPVLLVPACGLGSGAAAACAGPETVELSPDSGAPRTSVDVTVDWLREGCNDYSGADEERPRSDVPVYFSQQDVETLVGTMSATGERYRGTLSFDVPPTARPGSAELHLGSERAVIGTFTVE